MDKLIQDIRYAARLLTRSPGFVVTAVLLLGLGIGANTAIFTIVDTLFLRPLPAQEPNRLVWLTTLVPPGSRATNLSHPDYLDVRDHSEAFTGVLATSEIPVALASGGAAQRLRGEMVTGNYFSLLGVQPELGRLLGAGDDREPSAARVVVLAHALWERRFASDPSLVGRSMTLDGQEFTVVGIAPASFPGLREEGSIDLWVPLAAHAQVMPGSERLLSARDAAWLRVLGRLKPGVTPAQARARLAVLARGIESSSGLQRPGLRFQVSSAGGTVHPTSAGEALSIVILLMGVTGLVLLIACGNLANLLLARAAARSREIGIRLALGATRMRLVRQLLTESVLLSLLGGAAGFAMALWGTDLLMAFAEIPRDVVPTLSPDLRIFAFTLAVSLACGVVFGLAPAVHATRQAVAAAPGDAAPALRGEARRGRPQRLMVAAQVALSMVLLVCAGLFLASLSKAARVDPGFDAAHGLALSFDLELQGYSRDQSLAFNRELLRRVAALPDVESASLASLAPLSGRMVGMELSEPGDAGAEGGRRMVAVNAVYPGYFRTLGIPILRGREFAESDDAAAPGVAIVNQACASSLWPGQNPLGKRVSLEGPGGPLLEVVGVARDAKFEQLSESPRPFVYLAHPQSPDLLSETALLVRARQSPAALRASVEHELHSLDASLPVFSVATFAENLRLSTDKQRALTKLLSLFSGLALLLASVGLYGVLAFVVVRRTREIGIRLAVGAQRRDILKMLVGEGLRLTLWGVAAGLILSAGLTRLLSGVLFGITPADLGTIVLVALALTVVGAAASALPARRAMRIDPMAALRVE